MAWLLECSPREGLRDEGGKPPPHVLPVEESELVLVLSDFKQIADCSPLVWRVSRILLRARGLIMSHSPGFAVVERRSSVLGAGVGVPGAAAGRGEPWPCQYQGLRQASTPSGGSAWPRQPPGVTGELARAS